MKKSCILGFALIISAFLADPANAKKGDRADGDSVNTRTETSSGQTPAGGGGGGGNPFFIPVDSANKMLQSYLTSVGADADSNMNLQSLILDADALREYLNNPDIKKVKIMFAHTLSYINSGHQGQPCGYKSGALTIVVAGVDENNDYVMAPPGDQVMDRAAPCPSNCGLTGTASDMLIH